MKINQKSSKKLSESPSGGPETIASHYSISQPAGCAPPVAVQDRALVFVGGHKRRNERYEMNSLEAIAVGDGHWAGNRSI